MKFKPKIKEKRWNPKIEQLLFKKWQKEKLFEFNKKSKKPTFSIDTPPPYVNVPVHIGQAYTYSLMDLIARYKRMIGFNVLFPIGLDKNGLPIEVQAEKKFKILLHETPREEFIKKCKILIEEAGDTSLDTFRKLGISFNSWETAYEIGGKYDTDDPEYRKLTQETFINLWNRGLIYEDTKPTNYCPVCGTTISDAEVEYYEGKTQLNYIKFRVKETDEEIVIATTRPELLCTCKVILFNPTDKRYANLKDKTAIVPVFNQEVTIISHPYAKPEFGSGLVMICSFGDYSDVRILRELNIQPTYAIDEKGKMNEQARKYKGLSIKEARERIIEDLKQDGLIVKQELIEQRQPICWRSKNPIEFIPLKEFYLKQLDFKEEILKIADKMKYFSPESKQILLDWVNSLNIDWVISRRRYYGTEIPLWYCNNCDYIFVPKAGKYYVPWKEKAPIEKCPKCGSKEFRGETRVFDTWFDSSNSEIYILGYLWDKEFFKKNFPCSLRPQGKEIVRTWLYFTLLKAYLLFKKPAFRENWLHHHVVDEKGEKMSKSLGNVIDPQEVIKRYGAEAFRIWSCLEGDITKWDIRCSFQRIEGTSKFLTKLWNIARFISSFPVVEKARLTETDKWILAELSKLVEKVRNSYEGYSFYNGVTAIRDFAWNLFAAHYLEMAKTRAYGKGFSKVEQKSAHYTLHTCLKTILLMLSPVIPFVTEDIWQKLYSKKSIHLEQYPKPAWKSNLVKLTDKITEFNSSVWNKKKERGISMKGSIAVDIPKELKAFEKDLKVMHNIS
ncbi:MAG: valine--tRNA ligase [Candidatus Aenigmatarchaeota archaeon]